MMTQFYQPTDAEQTKITLVRHAIDRLSAAITGAADNHESFGEMVCWMSNKERWQWIKPLKPIVDFYNKWNRTTVNPATGLNQVEEPVPDLTSRDFLTEADLTDEERGIVMQLADLQSLRVKAIARAICEGELLRMYGEPEAKR
jgi:hypothetical protein